MNPEKMEEEEGFRVIEKRVRCKMTEV